MKRALHAIVCAFLALSVCNAQQPLEPQQPPTFKAETQLVLVPTVVKDSHGTAIHGLKQEAFAITVDGKPQRIASFEEITAANAATPGGKLASGVFSNYATDDPRPQRLTVIVIDLINTGFLDQARTRAELLDFIEKHLDPKEPVSLLAISRTGIKQIHSFTRDTGRLIQALQKVKGEVSTSEELAGDAIIDNDIQSEVGALSDFNVIAGERYAKFARGEAVRKTLEALEQVTNAFAGVPGRKNIVWATAGFPFMLNDPDSVTGLDGDFVPRYERLWRLMNSSNISIYPVDVKGVTNYVFDTYFSPQIRTSRRIDPTKYNTYNQSQDTLRSFADATGGVACIGRNDFSHCFEKAVDDSRDYYMIAFYVSPEIKKEGWHKMKVRVNSSGKVDVRARQGFFIGNQSESSSPQQDLKQVATALSSSVEYTGLHFYVQWADLLAPRPQPAPANGQKPLFPAPVAAARFHVVVPPEAFVIDRSNQNHTALEVTAVALNEKGKFVGEFSKMIEAHLKPESLDKVETGGLSYSDAMNLPAGKIVVRFAVRDKVSGKIGTVEAPVIVQPFEQTSRSDVSR